MKIIAYLVLLVPILLELSEASPLTAVDEYGNVYRSEPVTEVDQYQPLADDDDADDEEDADDEDTDDDENDDNSGIYPPDFAKLFPNPDGRPVGPDSYDSYTKHHPANYQPNKPSHGPAASPGPAASRGPVPQRSPPRNQEAGNHGGYARPQYDAPPPNYGQGRPGPVRRQYNRPPPGPPPQGPPSQGPPPQYRTEVDFEENEIEEAPTGRQLYYVAGHRQVQRPVYPTNRRNTMQYYNTRRNYQMVVPNRRYTTRPRAYPVPMTMSTWPGVRGPVTWPVSRVSSVPWTRQGYGRDFPRTNAFSRYSVHSNYNPEYVVNPTEMLSRRKFRYHPSQRIPSQRIALYPGYWPNPWIGHHYQKW